MQHEPLKPNRVTIEFKLFKAACDTHDNCPRELSVIVNGPDAWAVAQIEQIKLVMPGVNESEPDEDDF